MRSSHASCETNTQPWRPKPTRSARFFLGKFLCVRAPDGYAEGLIIETEAYGGPQDAASHAYGNRRTSRTESGE